MLASWLFAVGVFSIFLWLWRSSRKSPRGRDGVLPPGPRALPIIGNLHQIAKDAPVQLSGWAKEYGKLYTIYMGNKPTIVINDAALLRKIFGLQASTGKFFSEIFDSPFRGPYGIFNSSGEVWLEQRNFLINAMKHAGLTKSAVMEPLILEELEVVCQRIKKEMDQEGKVYFAEIFKGLSGNVVWAAMTEERSETPIAAMMQELTRCLHKVSNSGLAFFSWKKNIAPKMTGYTEYMQVCTEIRQFVRDSFNDPRRSGGHHQDLIYKYIEHVKKTKDKTSSFYGEEGLKHSFGSVLGILLAGVETTSNTMNFLMSYLCAYPAVQERIQEEIAEVIGEGREPSLHDRQRMPYTEAVVEETLRMASPAPIGIIHVLLEDVDLLGYKLPKGLCLLPNIQHILYDPEVWGDPETFRPERFLPGQDSEENRAQLKEFMVAFQPGKRVCPGEPLARDMLFLHLTKFLGRFTFEGVAGATKEEYMEKIFGYVTAPKRLAVVAMER